MGWERWVAWIVAIIIHALYQQLVMRKPDVSMAENVLYGLIVGFVALGWVLPE